MRLLHLWALPVSTHASDTCACVLSDGKTHFFGGGVLPGVDVSGAAIEFGLCNCTL